MSPLPSPRPAFLRNGRALQKNAGLLVGAGLAATAAVVAITGRRWRAAEDPCAATVLDTEGAKTFKVERPDGTVLDGVVVGPEDGPPGGMGGVPPTTAAGAATERSRPKGGPS